jgi:cytidylate kinase
MSAEFTHERPEEFPLSGMETRESPRHGFRGEPRDAAAEGDVPLALTVAISREAGSRGASIATRAGQKLGWQIYNQELLEYIAQEGNFRQDIVANLPAPAARWAEHQLERLLREQNLSQHPTIIDLARIILALGAQGEVILVGRGAGLILPHASTLHVRTVAPLADRVAYVSQWLRLTEPEAAEQVRIRDTRRSDFIATHFHRQPGDVHQYDLVLNTSLLGEDLCAELIAHAARAKLAHLHSQRHGADEADESEE